jgi:hypothetical protein
VCDVDEYIGASARTEFSVTLVDFVNPGIASLVNPKMRMAIRGRETVSCEAEAGVPGSWIGSGHLVGVQDGGLVPLSDIPIRNGKGHIGKNGRNFGSIIGNTPRVEMEPGIFKPRIWQNWERSGSGGGKEEKEDDEAKEHCNDEMLWIDAAGVLPLEGKRDGAL